MASIGTYTYHLESDPQGILIGEQTNPRTFQRIYFKDSILKFFPYAELYINDPTSIISDTFFFTEGLKLKALLGSEEEGYLGHDYCWTEAQINDVKFANHIAGNQVFVMLSNYYNSNTPSTKAYQGEISDVVTDIVTDEFNIPNVINKVKNQIISATANGKDEIWYQGNRTNRDFIEYLSSRAFSSIGNSISPFVTFINTNGEFYFTTIHELYQQAPVKTLKLQMNDNMASIPGYIKQYDILHGGMPVNKANYRKDIITLPEDGSVTTETIDLGDHYVKIEGTSKMLVRKDYVKTNSRIDYGIVEDTDVNNIKGRQNFGFLNSCMSYRMTVVDLFDPKLVSGKVIELEIEKVNDDNNISLEYSGKWLIIGSEVFDDSQMSPYVSLSLAKPSITLPSDHVFKDDYI